MRDKPRRFDLMRERDITGVTGTGLIAEGVEFSNGLVVLDWVPLDETHMSSVAIWPSIDDMMRVHGHDGATQVRWID